MQKIFVFGLTVVGIALGGWANIRDLTGESTDKLPSQILQFYDDVNYICSHTTRDERMRMASRLNHREFNSCPDGEGSSEIWRRLKRVQQRFRFFNQAVPVFGFKSSAVLAAFLRPDFYEITYSTISLRSAVITLTVYDVTPEGPHKLRGRNGSNGALPSTRSQSIQRKEAHKWIFQGGAWWKMGTNILFIKNESGD